MSSPIYHLAAEKEYCNVIVQTLEDGQLEIPSKIRQDVLNPLMTSGNLNSGDVSKVEQEVCNNLLAYLKKVKYIRDQKFTEFEETAILKHEWAKLNLHFTSANKINASLLSRHLKPLSAFDQLDKLRWKAVCPDLWNAIDREGRELPEATKNKLKDLEKTLDNSELDISLPKEVECNCKEVECNCKEVECNCKVNYIPLWRSLKNREWKIANYDVPRKLDKGIR